MYHGDSLFGRSFNEAIKKPSDLYVFESEMAREFLSGINYSTLKPGATWCNLKDFFINSVVFVTRNNQKHFPRRERKGFRQI